jgi:hypothetical protein
METLYTLFPNADELLKVQPEDLYQFPVRLTLGGIPKDGEI